MKCAVCQVVGDCKHAFGKYWSIKSRGGEGCSKPFPGWPKNWRRKLEEPKANREVKKEVEAKDWIGRFL